VDQVDMGHILNNNIIKKAKTTTESNGNSLDILTEMYSKQSNNIEKSRGQKSIVIPPSAIIITVVGIFLLIFSIDYQILWMIFSSISIIFIIVGVFLLRERISMLKPLIGGAIFLYFGLFGIYNAILLMTDGIKELANDGIFYIVMAIIILILTIFTTIAGICSVIRRGHKYSILGGLFCIVIGVILGWIPLILSIGALILIFLSEKEFEEDL
jgi:hypothetical protein